MFIIFTTYINILCIITNTVMIKRLHHLLLRTSVHNSLILIAYLLQPFINIITFYNILVTTCKHIKGIAATQFIVMSNV